MIVVLQRVARAAIRVGGADAGAIGTGVCLLVCAVAGDVDADALWLAEKIAGLRVFEDDAGRTDLDLASVGGAVLLVPQFTLAADWRRGRRPSFSGAARPERARDLLALLAGGLVASGLKVVEGRFGAAMEVDLVNQGPFTLVLDSKQRPRGARGIST